MSHPPILSRLTFVCELEQPVIHTQRDTFPISPRRFFLDPRERAPVSCASHQPKCVLFEIKKSREYLYPAREARISKAVDAPELWHVPRRTVSHGSIKVRQTIGREIRRTSYSILSEYMCNARACARGRHHARATGRCGENHIRARRARRLSPPQP